MRHSIYKQFTEKKQLSKKSFAVLIDPDKVDAAGISQIVALGIEARVDYFFVGGSLVISSYLDDCIQQIKQSCTI
ncbi:hypothetical protein ACSTII_00135, partial [Vibrio parahaemolyticus]